MKSTQKEAFLGYEGNAWFDRNKEVLLDFNAAIDPVLRVIKDYQILPNNCLEIGASVGHRLHAIQQLYPTAQVAGIEPSSSAVEKSRLLFQNIDMIKGTSDDLSAFEDESFDLIIAGFFLYVLDRKYLLKTISEIDRVLKNNGRLIIYDFFSVKPKSGKYHHIQSFDAYSFKQNYEDIFLASGLYHLLHKETMNHATFVRDNGNDFNNKSSVTALIKDTQAVYQ